MTMIIYSSNSGYSRKHRP